MTLGLINANPVVQAKKERIVRTQDQYKDDGVDPLEIYDILFLFEFWLDQIGFNDVVLDLSSFWCFLFFMFNFGIFDENRQSM